MPAPLQVPLPLPLPSPPRPPVSRGICEAPQPPQAPAPLLPVFVFVLKKLP
jgi:hypothetical protein